MGASGKQDLISLVYPNQEEVGDGDFVHSVQSLKMWQAIAVERSFDLQLKALLRSVSGSLFLPACADKRLESTKLRAGVQIQPPRPLEDSCNSHCACYNPMVSWLSR